MERYWVVGGEYSSMAFKALKDGAQQMLGPYDSREEACAVWRRISQETKACATARYAIASERLVMPA